ncbi:hypothetical protein KM043_014140 [Ampulex compressa]|nr:hypothetical protein KM043_014140 [Ampulex compressa]
MPERGGMALKGHSRGPPVSRRRTMMGEANDRAFIGAGDEDGAFRYCVQISLAKDASGAGFRYLAGQLGGRRGRRCRESVSTLLESRVPG